MSLRTFVSARKPNTAVAAIPTIRTALPVVSQSPERSDPTSLAVTPAVAIAVEKYASASPKIAKPMNAKALGHVGFFMAMHSIWAARFGQCRRGTRVRSQRNRSSAVVFRRPERGRSKLLFSMKTQASSATLRDRVGEDMPRIRSELPTLVRIPSISHPGHDPSQLGRSAEATAKILRDAGCETKIVEIEGVPAVIGHVAAPAGAPTVLLYAHHDVQPTGGRDLWHSDPFEPIEKNGRLYGRGTSDDKCGVVMHAGALRAHGGRPPVGVTVFVEGEEEWGSPNLGKFLAKYGDLLKADAVVHDDRGNVAVKGIATGKADPLDLTEEELRKQVGMRPGVKLIGDGGITDRMWMKPAVSILGIDAPRLTESTNQLVPSAK